MSFINPVKYGRMESETSKSKTYSPEPSDVIVAPYDGMVYDVSQSKCDGYIKIAHLLNGNIFYSEICGVDKGIYVATNVNVKKGDVIGAAGGKPVNYEIKDSGDNKVSLAPFFSGGIEKTTEPKKDKDQDKGLGKPEKEKEKEKLSTDDDLNKKEKKSWDFSNIEKPKDLPNLFTSLMLTPFYALEKGLTSKKKKETKEEEQLQEQLNKIKRLLK